MRTCILFLSFLALNAMEDSIGKSEGYPVSKRHIELGARERAASDHSDPFISDSSSPTEGMEEEDIKLGASPPELLMRNSSSARNVEKEREYYESHPQLFYRSGGEEVILTAKIKNFGKILRCGTPVNIDRIAFLLVQMPEILTKLRRNLRVILRNLKDTSEEYIRISMNIEIVQEIETKIKSTEPLSVNELLAVFGNINASIIDAQNIVSQLIKKRLDSVLQEVQRNKGMRVIANSLSSQFEKNISDYINRLGNAVGLLNEFFIVQKDILSFSNLLQDFFLQKRNEEVKLRCTDGDLLAALKGD
ncbi:MAG: hypothetical protein WCJ92_01610 [Alphaproteobacteria bacterium]